MFMKKLFTVMLLGSFFVVSAQIEKGTVMVGGNLGLKTGDGTSEILVNPNIGFFVANNFTIGGHVNYSSRELGATKVNEFGIGPFARYYFGVTSTKPFLVTEFDFLSSTTKVGEQKITTSGTGFLFGMGFAAFINETVAIEGITGYNYAKYKETSGSGGFAMRFGFQIYLNNRNMKELKTNVIGQ
jgi:hypothetical protein